MALIPESLIIPHDYYYGRFVGVARDGIQFFITTPFISHLEGVEYPKDFQKEFVALFLFSHQGELLKAEVEDLGPRTDLLGAEAAKILPGNIARENPVSGRLVQHYLDSLGEVTYQDIRVKPFEFERFGVRFGLIPQYPEEQDEEDDFMYLILEPGNYMAFMPPWEGDYDT